MALVLVTGGAGYIGSHTVVELLNAGFRVVVVDNFSNSSPEALNRVKAITGKDFEWHALDLVTDAQKVDKLFEKHQFSAVIHFAGLKAVGESTKLPLKYFSVNLQSTMNLLQSMITHNVKNFVFSSSATVYGEPDALPITEQAQLKRPTNPYGRTKFFIEEMMRDLHAADSTWNVTLLRYFNPVGAHISGKIGEDPSGIPNNLMPFVTQVAIGKRAKVSVFGGDYKTKDGTGVRDYLHVTDLAIGHVAALKKLLNTHIGCEAFNLGTGTGYSVLEMIAAMKAASGKEIPYEIVARRAGDVAEVYADASKAKKELGWTSTRGLQEMCVDAWRWQSSNPNGYNSQAKH